MSVPGKQHLQLSYEFEGDMRKALVEISQTKASITFSGLSSLKFQFAFNDPDNIILNLPSDKKGQKPSMACDIACIPELGAAIEEMKRQAWLTPKVIDSV